MTKVVSADDGESTKYSFNADITCDVPGSYALEWTVTIAVHQQGIPALRYTLGESTQSKPGGCRTCYRYIELNPVAANMVKHPGDYAWSSYHHNVSGEKNPIITQHDLYRRLGMAEEERRSRYRALFINSLTKEDIHTIRSAARFSMPVGDSRFKIQIERALGCSIGHAKRGRPSGKRKRGG